jgi:hypothetical protein
MKMAAAALSLLLAAAVSAAQPAPPPPAAPPPPPPGQPGPTLDENDDDDNDVRRVRVNAQATLELPAGKVQVIYPLLPADSPDAAAIAGLGDGDVLALTRAMAVKLKTEVELRFDGGAVARPGNAASGYPGVYSLWLRRRGDGWSMVLNGEPDIWGTMRDPAADVGESTLAHRRDEAAARDVLEVSLLQTNGGGTLTLAWGPDRWTAEFEAGPGMNAAAAESR